MLFFADNIKEIIGFEMMGERRSLTVSPFKGNQNKRLLLNQGL